MPSQVSFTLPGGQYAAEAERIARRRRMAEALQQESMQPLEMPKTPGVRLSPFEGLAKMLRSVNARKGFEIADEEAKSLAGRVSSDRSATLAQALRTAQGTPGSSEAIMDEQAAGGEGAPAMISAPAVKGDYGKALAQMLTSGDPMLTQVGPAVLDQYKPRTPVRVDVGGAIELRDPLTNQLVTSIPKSATPDTLLREGGAQKRHETPSGSANLSATTTRRGQDLADARARDANAVAAGQKLQGEVTGLRKEFNDVDEVKKYRTVLPIIESAKRAPNTPAGDLDLIYAVGKVLDPTSVVREGELALVIKSGSPIERLKGTVQFISQGKGRLTEAQRAQLTGMLEGRVGELKKGYDAARALYGRTAGARGLPADQIFMEDGGAGGGNVINFADLPGGR